MIVEATKPSQAADDANGGAMPSKAQPTAGTRRGAPTTHGEWRMNTDFQFANPWLLGLLLVVAALALKDWTFLRERSSLGACRPH